VAAEATAVSEVEAEATEEAAVAEAGVAAVSRTTSTVQVA